MPELPYRQFTSYLNSLKQGKCGIASVYLLHGDELLCKTALTDLLDVLIPAEDRITRYEAYEGLPENLPRAIESLQTFSFFPGIKVVGFLDTTLFTERLDASKLYSKWQEACSRRETRNAASYLLKLLTVRSIEIDAQQQTIFDGLNDLGMSDADRSRLAETLTEARKLAQEDRPVDGMLLLEAEIRRGLPEGHHLILTAESVDRRKSFYKFLVEQGVVVDCSVPKEFSTKASRQEMESLLDGEIQRILVGSGKRLSGAARAALLERTGYDLRMVTSELPKLIQYSGKRTEITVEDVADVVSRTKKDPIFELTNAVLERKTAQAISMITSLLEGDLFPPQILTALHNQLRKMILARTFLDQTGIDVTRMDFDAFRSHLVPRLMSFEDALNLNYREWQQRMEPPEIRAHKKASSGKASDGGRITDTEIRLLKKGRNPYPVYLLLKRVQAFSTERLIQWMRLLGEADERLKSGALDAKAVLEYVVIAMCSEEKRNVQQKGRAR
ncbi:MAG: DNA polymerase III subunit delta [Thermodesulfobacteriota bacterium]